MATRSARMRNIGVFPTEAMVKTLESALRVAEEMIAPEGSTTRVTTLAELDSVVRDEASRHTLEKTATWYMTCSLGLYPGPGKILTNGESVEDKFGCKDGTRIILDSGSIPEAAKGIPDAFLFYPKIGLEEIIIDNTGRAVLYMPARDTGIVLTPFTHESERITLPPTITGSETTRHILRYADESATRVGFVARSVFEGLSDVDQEYIAVCLRPGTDPLGLAVVHVRPNGIVVTELVEEPQLSYMGSV